jgi:hypothetical protein
LKRSNWAPSSLRYHSRRFQVEELRRKNFEKKPLSTSLRNHSRGYHSLEKSHWAPSSLRYHAREFQIEELGEKKLWKEAIEHHHLFATIPEDFMLKNQGEKNFEKKPLSTIIFSLPFQRILCWRIREKNNLKRSHWAPSSLCYHSRGFHVEEMRRKKLWKEVNEHHHLFATIPEDFILKN